MTTLGSVVIGVLAFTPGFDMSPLGLLAILAFGGLPLLFYVTGVQTAAASYVAGTALLASVGVAQGYISAHSYSSTVDIGYVWIFFGESIIVLVSLFIERASVGART
jgi:hypothetical protein